MVGGLLIQWLGDDDGWRSIFFVNLPFGVIAVVAALILLPSGAEGKAASGADLSASCCWPAAWSPSWCR